MFLNKCVKLIIILAEKIRHNYIKLHVKTQPIVVNIYKSCIYSSTLPIAAQLRIAYLCHHV